MLSYWKRASRILGHGNPLAQPTVTFILKDIVLFDHSNKCLYQDILNKH